MGVKGEPDIIERKRLQWYSHVKRMPEDRIPKLIMEWIPQEKEKRTSKKNVDGTSTSSHGNKKLRNSELDQWRNREEWRLVSGRRRQLLKKPDR